MISQGIYIQLRTVSKYFCEYLKYMWWLNKHRYFLTEGNIEYITHDLCETYVWVAM